MLFGRLLSERGFQVLIQSCRGTFGSGGSFDPFAEREDGLATLAWMREQPWYPGSFGTAGPSYLGIVQWAIAAEAGEDHKAMAVQVTSSDLHATVYEGGSFSLANLLGWADQIAHQERPFALIRQQVAAARRLAPLFGRLPLADLDRQAVGKRVEYWQDWLSRTDPDDPYWAPRRFTEGPAAVRAPVSFVAGWDDIFLPAQLRDYMALRAAGKEPYLLIGPWQHAEPGNIAATVKDSMVWLRAHLLDDTSQLRPTPVRIYVGGAGQWRDLPSWPPAATEQRWHLQADGGLHQEVPQDGEPDEYIYDPASPTPSVGGPLLARVKGRPDNRALEARPDVRTYTSAPLERDLDVIGHVRADLFVRSSLEHTDFFARLCDVDPSGRSTNICDALIRLTPGRPAPEPDGAIRVRIELWPTAHRFRRGHRIRLAVSSGAHPRYARNPGTGEPLATASSLHVANQRIYHDPGHPSAIILPVAG
jgi:putative CocE/NonD family hydrolase